MVFFMLVTIKSSSVGLGVGNHKASFVGIEATTTVKGAAWRWKFRTDDGQDVGYFSGDVPSSLNKAGRWLSALSGKPVGVPIQTDDYVGKRYLLIITNGENGGTKLETFTAI
jgi:hypothetical protein